MSNYRLPTDRQRPKSAPAIGGLLLTLSLSLLARAAPPLDEGQVQAAGIRKLTGHHLTLWTDLPAQPEIDQLPSVFDAAVPLWCDYFRVDPEAAEQWHVHGYLIKRPEPFQALGLLPANLPRFLNGYSRGDKIWLYEQPSSYYRRHLLLHEGTHAFMQNLLKGLGPPWFSEGMAELLGTHRWQDGSLTLRYFPPHRDEVPQWGRIKIVQTEREAGQEKSIEQILGYSASAHLQNAPYGWCWALTAFLDGHPQFGDRFRRLPRRVDKTAREFTSLFQTQYRPDRRQLNEQWQLFLANLCYGYDLTREAIIYEPRQADRGASVTVQIQADRGWQSTGIEIQPGALYSLAASGRYQVAREPKIWWCEPGGVTIRYHQGRPLGMLLGGVSDQTKPLSGITPLAAPLPIGLHREMTFPHAGTLFLRINDSPAELADNAGMVDVVIQISAQ